MNVLWSYFWPLLTAGLLVGAVAGSIAFRLPRTRSRDRLAGDKFVARDSRRKRMIALVAGAAAAIAVAALWSGPLGAADRLADIVERNARATLVNYEMTQVTVRLHRSPLTRRIILSGPADDLQRAELMRIMGGLPGVSDARWAADGGGPPLILEGAAVSLLGFLFGLLLAYLFELRRRYNAQWDW